MSSLRENGALHAINTLRLASQLSGSSQNYKKRTKKKIKPWVKLNYIMNIQKGEVEDQDVRKERVKTQRKPAQLKGK